MSRLEGPLLDGMDEAQRRVHDEIAGGPRAGVRGPLAVWLWRPDLAERAQALGRYCRYDTSLAPRLSELAILVTARVWSSEYEWQAHKKIALAAGLDPAIVDAIRDGREPRFEASEEAVVFEFAMALQRDRRVAADLYDRAVAALGRDRLVDLVGVLGYYGLISMTINAFEVDPPDPAHREMS